ncbi:MAG: single-stranded DNA-binding protein [Dermatophilaceae bacterium]|nr:single-stranded DNA-binding protein [Dermatophilaceae bacterium]
MGTSRTATETVGRSVGRAVGRTDGRTTSETAPDAPPGRNQVVLAGRVAAAAEERELPSGDRIVTLRVVVPRAGPPRRRKDAAEGARRATVDTIDVVCWTATTRRSALRLQADDLVELEGALRRRFFGGPGGRQSRYEVEASALRRVSGSRSTGT